MKTTSKLVFVRSRLVLQDHLVTLAEMRLVLRYGGSSMWWGQMGRGQMCGGCAVFNLRVSEVLRASSPYRLAAADRTQGWGVDEGAKAQYTCEYMFNMCTGYNNIA
jgi:hypothetical protein